MGERVVESGIRIQWEPNAPDAVMVSNDAGRTALASYLDQMEAVIQAARP